ncbi:hypothetical protein [Laspinema olomoucense]|uniref:Uncharacterized protein n=1 Tax=Laspinema olomoucense D3b TaxID=2953688 RepID=A0ABT2NB10_9CYAN|nr:MULTISPECIES: hypothetical protein [unclassified Laspinema]MCT7973814.1 hypothetical protein [Laspinema sp. D3d]MCT7978900.1 hypothetical protein [Laspinema sp. D3b]MCT7988451.1 hypothetical protein [Laspinema sp. D3a]MCT7996292.1 hypothetical protein [Laspinema sp. D3c]
MTEDGTIEITDLPFDAGEILGWQPLHPDPPSSPVLGRLMLGLRSPIRVPDLAGRESSTPIVNFHPLIPQVKFIILTLNNAKKTD